MQSVVDMKAEEILARLEKHEAECNLRYKNIEERLDHQRSYLEKLDKRLWQIAALIIVSYFANHIIKVFG